jgi:TetR/AcrR family transcriptional repressor of mexJK operon
MTTPRNPRARRVRPTPRPEAPPPRRGRPPDLGKRQAILDAASRIFLARGFAGTSMDAVAEEAGVSKITVYAHFSDKETLFSAMIRARCEAYNRPERFAEYVDLPPRRALAEMGRNFLALLLDPEVVQLYRVISGEAGSRPDVAKLFYEAGPERAIELFTEYFRRAGARGHFEIDDPEKVADDFLALLKGRLHLRATLGFPPRERRAEIAAHVARAVDVMMRAFGRPAGR